MTNLFKLVALIAVSLSLFTSSEVYSQPTNEGFYEIPELIKEGYQVFEAFERRGSGKFVTTILIKTDKYGGFNYFYDCDEIAKHESVCIIKSDMKWLSKLSLEKVSRNYD